MIGAFWNILVQVLQPAILPEDESFNDILMDLDEHLFEVENLVDARKSKICAKFFDTHTTSRTYFYQIRQRADSSFSYHKPLRGQNEIEPFPDPVPIEQDGSFITLKDSTPNNNIYLQS